MNDTTILQIRQDTPTALIGSELKAFTRCENIIEKGVKTFIEVGKSLLEIKENRYYRDNYDTFQDYCKERWGFDRTYAHRLIEASRVTENVANCQQIPATESQARELAKLPDDAQAEAWEEVIKKTDGKPTAAAVREVVEERITPDDHDKILPLKGNDGRPKNLPVVTDAMSFAHMAISQLERIRADDPDKNNAFTKVENWIIKKAETEGHCSAAMKEYYENPTEEIIPLKVSKMDVGWRLWEIALRAKIMLSDLKRPSFKKSNVPDGTLENVLDNVREILALAKGKGKIPDDIDD